MYPYKTEKRLMFATSHEHTRIFQVHIKVQCITPYGYRVSQEFLI